jgi:copper(I)-binding protein
MRLLTRMAALALAMLAIEQAAMAHSHRHRSIEIVHPWTSATQAASTATRPIDAVIRMTIKLGGERADRLMAARTDIAEKVDLVAGPAPATAGADGSIVVPKGRLELLARGPHIRLSGVKKPLEAYDSFPLVLLFEHAGAVTVEVHIEDVAPANAR